MKQELLKLQHERSVREYPEIKLEENEYVVLRLTRSPLGKILIWGVVALLVLALTACVLFLASYGNLGDTLFVITEEALGYLWLAILMVFIIIIVGGFVQQMIYDSNKMYVTNRRIIQKTRTSIFAESSNIIELGRIEDVSWRQDGLLEHLLHYGTIRMSTVGDETTYTFPFLDTPHDEVDVISHLISEQKHKK